MRTRTLLLLAAACGLVILLAGGLKLLQVATDPEEVDTLAWGDDARIGDMTVSVDAIDTSGAVTLVQVRLGGVEGADAIDGWRLWADGATPRQPLGDDERTTCDTVEVPAAGMAPCTIAFEAVDTVQGIIYTRVGEQRQWAGASGAPNA